MSNQLFGGEDERELNAEFNKGLKIGRKQGAKEELELAIKEMKIRQFTGLNKDYFEKRLKDLECEVK